jgi:hypothetical protein
MSKVIKQGEARKWMLEGIKEHKGFVGLFRQAKDRALNAGFFFLSAKTKFEHGEWENFMCGYAAEVSARQIQFYMAFAEEAIEWVKREQPKLLGMERISAAARAMVMDSPKGLVALCRELKLMRRFGEYDAVKYRSKQIKGNQQMEFNYSDAADTLQLLCSDQVELPKDISQAEELAHFTKMAAERAAKWVKALKSTVNT